MRRQGTVLTTSRMLTLPATSFEALHPLQRCDWHGAIPSWVCCEPGEKSHVCVGTRLRSSSPIPRPVPEPHRISFQRSSLALFLAQCSTGGDYALMVSAMLVQAELIRESQPP